MFLRLECRVGGLRSRDYSSAYRVKRKGCGISLVECNAQGIPQGF
jgi:hypothetical protein